MTHSYLPSIRCIHRCGTIFFFLSFLSTITTTHRLLTLVNGFVPNYPPPHVQQQRLHYHHHRHQLVPSVHRYKNGCYGSSHRGMITQRPVVVLAASVDGADDLHNEGNGAGKLVEGGNGSTAHYDTITTGGGGEGSSINAGSNDVIADGKDNDDGITTSLLSELKEDADVNLDDEEEKDIDDEDNFEGEGNLEPNNNNVEYWKKKEKRVLINIRYTAKIPGLRSFYLTTAAKITRRHPDVLIEKMILPPIEAGDSSTQQQGGVFEILVDGKVVVGKGRSSWQGVRIGGNGSGSGGVGDGLPVLSGMSVFVSMQEVDASITKARRSKRRSTADVRSGVEDAYNTPAARLEILKIGRDGGME